MGRKNSDTTYWSLVDSVANCAKKSPHIDDEIRYSPDNLPTGGKASCRMAADDRL